MRQVGFFLLVMGWMLVLSAIALLHGAPQAAFLMAGLGVQALGLLQVMRSHLLPSGEQA